MKINKSFWLLSFIVVVLLILGGYIFFDTLSDSDTLLEEQNGSQEEKDLENQGGDLEYPSYLIEGYITGIELDPPEEKFRLEVNLEKIFPESQKSSEEVTVLIDESTRFFLFDLETGAESPIGMEELKKGDSVVVAINGNNQDVLDKDMFTAVGIKKMLGSPPK